MAPNVPRLKRNIPTPKRRSRSRRSTFDRSQHDELAGELGYFRVLSLDISSRAAGWALFEAGELVEYGVFYQEGLDHGERLVHFRAFLTDLLTTCQPTHVCYEEPYQSRQKYAFGILQLYVGVVLACHFEHFGYEVPQVNRVSAREVKRLNHLPSGLTHAQNKATAVERVNAWYGLDLKYAGEHHKQESGDDVADAVLVNRAWHRREHPELVGAL
jgi:Holliday junction resolvasome RuvABC endonuclease subunit